MISIPDFNENQEKHIPEFQRHSTIYSNRNQYLSGTSEADIATTGSIIPTDGTATNWPLYPRMA